MGNADLLKIAFDLKGKRQIHAMWHMICEGDIRSRFEIVHADEHSGIVRVVDDYTFSSTGRPVQNRIQSHFVFRDGRILEQRDVCDAKRWAAMALGGVSGFVAGRVTLLRRRRARQLLDAFITRHPEYRA